MKNFEKQKLNKDEMVSVTGGGFWNDFLDGNAAGVGVSEPDNGNFAYFLGYALGATCRQNGG